MIQESNVTFFSFIFLSFSALISSKVLSGAKLTFLSFRLFLFPANERMNCLFESSQPEFCSWVRTFTSTLVYLSYTALSSRIEKETRYGKRRLTILSRLENDFSYSYCNLAGYLRLERNWSFLKSYETFFETLSGRINFHLSVGLSCTWCIKTAQFHSPIGLNIRLLYGLLTRTRFL